jgi:hypothetical protein
MENEFSVWLFFPDESHWAEVRWVDVGTAVVTAKAVTLRPAAKTGLIWRVIITDRGDFTVFEWQYSKGVTFPPVNGSAMDAANTGYSSSSANPKAKEPTNA